jgi:glycosyl hydrolase family 10
MATRNDDVARLYRRYLDVVLVNKATIAVITWGFTDRESWITRGDLKDFLRSDGLPPHPLPFDDQYRPKRAYEEDPGGSQRSARPLKFTSTGMHNRSKKGPRFAPRAAGVALVVPLLHQPFMLGPASTGVRGQARSLAWRFFRLLARQPYMSGRPPARSSAIQSHLCLSSPLRYPLYLFLPFAVVEPKLYGAPGQSGRSA